MNIVIIGTTNNETSQISFGRPIERLINIFQVWKCFFNSANICVVLCFNKGKSLRHRHILIGIHKDQYLFKQMYFLQLNQIIMREGYQKFENSRRRQSEESSSLQFLSSDKQAEQNILMDEQNSINIISERRKRQWLQPVVQRNQNGYKKKQKSFEEQNNSIQSTFLYKPGVQLPNLFNFTNQTIKVIIASEYINKDNPSFIRHKVYGTDTYSSNSDCVCIGIHYGLFHFTTFSYKKYEGVEITFKVIKPKKNYVGTLKNGLQSENMKNYNGNSLKPESCKMLNSLGSIQSLQKYAANMHVPIGKARTRPRPNKLSSILPMPDSNLVFNMNNQPAYKYSIENIADKGFDKTDFMTRKLDFKVLYLETESKERYELLKYVQKTYFEAYRFSKLKNPLKFDNEYFSIHPSPLDTNDLEILQSLIQWDEITFGTGHVRIKDRKIQNLISFKYYTKQQK